MSDVTVTVPCIRNTEDNAPGTEIVLEWKGKRETQGTQPKATRVITAFTEGAPNKRLKHKQLNSLSVRPAGELQGDRGETAQYIQQFE